MDNQSTSEPSTPEFLQVQEVGPGKSVIPFPKILPFCAGIVGGLILRFLFSGAPGGSWSAMAGGFIYLAPMLVGAITVYVAETIERRSWGYYVWAPFLANLFFVLGTLVIMWEGLICAIVIVPMFAWVGSIGGMAMGIVCRITNWPKQAIISLAALPIALGLGGDYLPTPQVFSSLSATTFISAPPSVVWQQLNYADNIRPEEFGTSWAARIGVPMPLSGITETTETGRVRKSRWAKDVHFEEPIVDWQPERYMRWTYRFYPTSFPPHALDDHVVIGGHYFDLHDTSFRLTPVNGGTQLDIQANYRVSTQFNFYAERVALLLLANMLTTDLAFYKNRSEKS